MKFLGTFTFCMGAGCALLALAVDDFTFVGIAALLFAAAYLMTP